MSIEHNSPNPEDAVRVTEIDPNFIAPQQPIPSLGSPLREWARFDAFGPFSTYIGVEASRSPSPENARSVADIVAENSDSLAAYTGKDASERQSDPIVISQPDIARQGLRYHIRNTLRFKK